MEARSAFHILPRFAENREFVIRCAQACDVTVDTVRSWMVPNAEGKTTRPTGITLLYLYHFLAKEGYLVLELQCVKPPALVIGRAIAERRISLEEVARVVHSADKKQLYKQLLYGSSFLPDAEWAIEKLIAEKFVDIVNDAKAEFYAKRVDATIKPLHRSPARDPRTSGGGAPVHTPLHALLRALLLAAKPLAEELASERFSASERQAFRDSFEQNEMHALADALTALMSEQARNGVLKQQQLHYNGKE